MKLAVIAAVALIGLSGPPRADVPPDLSPTTAQAFQRYVQGVEAAADARAKGARTFLWADDSSARLQRLRRGEVVTERAAGNKPVEVDGGLIHDWIGAVFIPGVTLDDTLALVQDYSRHKNIYPEVVDSEVVSRDGDHFVIFLRVKKKKVITAVLDTTHDAQFFRLDANRVHSRSRTTRIAEVENFGTPQERQLALGTGHGFMWFLNSYWRFAARDGGVYVECQAVSLSRGIPWGFGWLIGPIVNDLPRESLEGTLTATRAALVKRTAQAGGSAQTQSMEGVWRTQGYGYVFQIHEASLNAFEVTATTCVPGFAAALDTGVVSGREATFKTSDGNVFFVRTGGTPDHKVLHQEGSASDVRIDRLPRLPAVCDPPTRNTPMDNFEVFSRTWAEHYISFDLKKTDWGKVVEANRSNVTSNTTPAELFDILERMIGPFGDTHAFIAAPELNRRVQNLRPGTDRVIKGGFQEFRSKGMAVLLGVTDRAYLKTPLRKFCNDQIEYGHVDETTGHLRILSFGGYVKGGDYAAGLAALEAALDAIFSDQALRRLVIDVRINGGGADPYGLAIASRLATNEYLAYTKEARADPIDRNKWTPGDPSRVRPSTRPGFRGPTVELIGPLTISAGETFTQALMGRTPRVTRIGENTQGVFSDVLSRRLPNGWRFGLPNEVFRTPQGTTFDGLGVPPDIVVPVFADADVAAGRDPGMAKALEILRGLGEPRR
jgi:hypothetical protein